MSQYFLEFRISFALKTKSDDYKYKNDVTYYMWHQDHCSETEEAKGVRVHSHCPERRVSMDKNELVWEKLR